MFGAFDLVDGQVDVVDNVEHGSWRVVSCQEAAVIASLRDLALVIALVDVIAEGVQVGAQLYSSCLFTYFARYFTLDMLVVRSS